MNPTPIDAEACALLRPGHPITNAKPTLATLELEQLVAVILGWMANLVPGGIVWGAPRIGKTKAINFMIQHVASLFGRRIPAAKLKMWHPSAPTLTENRFHQELLRQLGHPSPDTGRGATKRQRTVDFMVDRTRECDTNTFLLFLDEAQWLAIPQYHYLVDLHNQLDDRSVILVTVLVGTHELLVTRAKLRDKQQTQILQRFMADEHHIHGLVNQAHVARFCESFDLHSQYPEGSEVSFTRCFAPAAFDAGWRLEAQTPLIWDTIHRVKREHKVPRTPLPMQAMHALLRALLITLPDIDEAAMRLDPVKFERLYKSVAMNQIHEHARMTQ